MHGKSISIPLQVLAKTDGVDTGVIARYLGEHYARLHPWHVGSSVQHQLQDLLTRRAQVIVYLGLAPGILRNRLDRT
jgi:hypothetical protein